jgi:hypothetical protein
VSGWRVVDQVSPAVWKTVLDVGLAACAAVPAPATRATTAAAIVVP